VAQPKPTDGYAKRTIKYVESTLAELDLKQRSAYLAALHRYATEAMYLSFGAYRIKAKHAQPVPSAPWITLPFFC
jgi:hypothetical protein